MHRRNFLFSVFTSGIILHTKQLWSCAKKVCLTTSDAEGPYFKENAPFKNDLTQDFPNARAERIVVSGYILTDCESSIPAAIIDVWHACPDKEYDMSEKYRCRAKIKTDKKGFYEFKTFMPPHYPGRPRHIHYKIYAKGYKELTTQLYFKDDPRLENDYLYKTNGGVSRTSGVTKSGGIKTVSFNIHLQPS